MGWNTNVKTKPLMIDKLAEFIRELYLGIYSDLVVSDVLLMSLMTMGLLMHNKGVMMIQ